MLNYVNINIKHNTNKLHVSVNPYVWAIQKAVVVRTCRALFAKIPPFSGVGALCLKLKIALKLKSSSLYVVLWISEGAEIGTWG